MAVRAAVPASIEYEALQGERFAFCVAHFLNWARENRPNQEFEPEIVVQYATGAKYRPKSNSHEVARLFRNKSHIKKILETKWNCTLVALRGTGWRATISPKDTFDQVYEQRVRRYEAAKTRLVGASTLTRGVGKDLKGGVKKWYDKIEGSIRQLKAVEALPPKPKKEDDGNEE